LAKLLLIDRPCTETQERRDRSNFVTRCASSFEGVAQRYGTWWQFTKFLYAFIAFGVLDLATKNSMRNVARFIGIDGRHRSIRREHTTNACEISLLGSTKRWTAPAPRSEQDKQTGKSKRAAEKARSHQASIRATRPRAYPQSLLHGLFIQAAVFRESASVRHSSVGIDTHPPVWMCMHVETSSSHAH
jgi:hypothetical protein